MLVSRLKVDLHNSEKKGQFWLQNLVKAAGLQNRLKKNEESHIYCT
jgi:hypothetical protein